MDRSPDRLARSLADLTALGLIATRIPAVDGATIDVKNLADYQEPLSIRASNRPLMANEIGCYQSHLVAAMAFVATEAPFGLVFEDDFASYPDSKTDLQALLAWAPSNHNWDLFNLGRKAKWLNRAIHHLPSGRKVCRADYFPVTTSALVWSRRGAQKFLAEHSFMTMPVDVFLQSWCTANRSGLACSHALFGTSGAPSLIGATKADRRVKGKFRFNGSNQRRKVRNYFYAILAFLKVRRA